MKFMEYTVILERGEHNRSAYVPDLPGCVAAGRTRTETERLIGGAIVLHIEALREDGEPIPKVVTEAVRLAVPA